jgi:hypothetical protein
VSPPLTFAQLESAPCDRPQGRLSQTRPWFHHGTFYGFLLCFASTCVVAFYHFVLGWRAPFADHAARSRPFPWLWRTADDILPNHRCLEPCVSVQQMAGQHDCTERGEAKEDKAENGVHEAEEVRADAVGDKANDDG